MKNFTQKQINGHDLALVDKARDKMWYDTPVNPELAETEEGYKELRQIAIQLYHEEECVCGNY